MHLPRFPQSIMSQVNHLQNISSKTRLLSPSKPQSNADSFLKMRTPTTQTSLSISSFPKFVKLPLSLEVIGFTFTLSSFFAKVNGSIVRVSSNQSNEWSFTDKNTNEPNLIDDISSFITHHQDSIFSPSFKSSIQHERAQDIPILDNDKDASMSTDHNIVSVPPHDDQPKILDSSNNNENHKLSESEAGNDRSSAKTQPDSSETKPINTRPRLSKLSASPVNSAKGLISRYAFPDIPDHLLINHIQQIFQPFNVLYCIRLGDNIVMVFRTKEDFAKARLSEVNLNLHQHRLRYLLNIKYNGWKYDDIPELVRIKNIKLNPSSSLTSVLESIKSTLNDANIQFETIFARSSPAHHHRHDFFIILQHGSDSVNLVNSLISKQFGQSKLIHSDFSSKFLHLPSSPVPSDITSNDSQVDLNLNNEHNSEQLSPSSALSRPWSKNNRVPTATIIYMLKSLLRAL